MELAYSTTTEAEFLRLIEQIKAIPARHGELALMLREDHALYAGRGSATVAQIRGWLLLTMADLKLRDGLVFVLEELDNGMEAYLIAAAAYSLRRIAEPIPNILKVRRAFVLLGLRRYLLRALRGIRGACPARISHTGRKRMGYANV